MRKPMIGLTPSVSENQKQVMQNIDYTEAVRRGGALPVILPMTDNADTLNALVDALDGVVLSGGVDLSPSLYGEEALPACGRTDALRDTMEIIVLRRCLATKKPILAICRGFELLNVALGGTLYQDIATQRPDSLFHPCYDTPADQVHTVRLVAGTKLARIEGMEEVRVNSRHHQGVNKVGEGLIVSAYASDGLVEGLELQEYPFVVGIQWHPETLSSYAPEALRIFEALADAARERPAC